MYFGIAKATIQARGNRAQYIVLPSQTNTSCKDVRKKAGYRQLLTRETDTAVEWGAEEVHRHRVDGYTGDIKGPVYKRGKASVTRRVMLIDT